MAKPIVSVLIDTCNHERFIEKVLVTVLEQDFPTAEREVVVVDDGSSPDTGGGGKVWAAGEVVEEREWRAGVGVQCWDSGMRGRDRRVFGLG